MDANCWAARLASASNSYKSALQSRSGNANFNDPLYIHPSDTPGTNLVNDQLIGVENYGIWSRAMLIALRAKNKIAFIDGSQTSLQWERCNALVLSWIMNTVSKEIFGGIIYASDASKVWADLKEQFDKVNGSRIFWLHREIGRLSQGNTSISTYYCKLKQLWDEYSALVILPSCECDVAKKYVEHEQQQKLLQFLMGLNDSYILCVDAMPGMEWGGFDAEMLMGFEKIEADDDKREEYICPFCSHYFDIVGLCCHIDDEHPVEAKDGVCPVCSMRVGVNMIAHITLQHGNIFKMQRNRKSRRAGSQSTLSLLRRELREGNLQSLFGGLATIVSSGNAAPDPLISSFIVPMVEDIESVPSHSSIKSELSKKNTSNSILDRKFVEAPLSFKDKEEKTKRCDFVQEMLLSMTLDDN